MASRKVLSIAQSSGKEQQNCKTRSSAPFGEECVGELSCKTKQYFQNCTTKIAASEETSGRPRKPPAVRGRPVTPRHIALSRRSLAADTANTSFSFGFAHDRIFCLSCILGQVIPPVTQPSNQRSILGILCRPEDFRAPNVVQRGHGGLFRAAEPVSKHKCPHPKLVLSIFRMTWFCAENDFCHLLWRNRNLFRGAQQRNCPH